MARVAPLFFAFALTAAGQVTAPPAPDSHSSAQQVATSSSLAATLPQLQRFVENARVDLARLRVDKWKTDTAVKQQVEANIESLQRNLSGALPTLVTAAQQNPSSLNASFKLYRNVNVLYDVMSGVTENAGAFGAKEEYSALAQDLNNLDSTRRSLAEAMDAMTAQRDADFTRIQQAAQRAQQATVAAPPKKIVIDDTEAEKKPAPKKKKAATPPAAPKQ
jgi:hypothetical protein